MSAPLDPVADIDRRITVAYSDLGDARARFASDPSGEAVTACESAEAAMNELLELRLRHTRGPRNGPHTAFPAMPVAS